MGIINYSKDRSRSKSRLWSKVTNALQKDQRWLILLVTGVVLTYLILIKKSLSNLFSLEPIIFFMMGFFKDLGNAIAKPFVNTGKKIWNGVKSAGNTVWNGLKSAGNWIIGAGKTIGGGLKSAWNWYLGVGETILGGMISASDWILGAVATAGKAIGKGIKSIGNLFKKSKKKKSSKSSSQKSSKSNRSLKTGAIIGGGLLVASLFGNFFSPSSSSTQTVRCGMFKLQKCTVTPEPSATFTLIPTNTPTQTLTPTSPVTATNTSTPTTASVICATHLSPANNIDLGSTGPVLFEWNPQEDAVKYIFVIFFGDGEIVYAKETTDTSITRYLESIPKGGQYGWHVTALDANDKEICRSDSWDFTKIKFIPTETPTPSFTPTQSGPLPTSGTPG